MADYTSLSRRVYYIHSCYIVLEAHHCPDNVKTMFRTMELITESLNSYCTGYILSMMSNERKGFKSLGLTESYIIILAQSNAEDKEANEMKV